MNKPRKENNVSYSDLKNLLDYDENSGIFTWKKSRGNVKAGNVASVKHSEGYLTLNINKKQYFQHRLAWFYQYGEWPKNFIDHINGKKDDNRICNLRDVDLSKNNQNLKRAKINSKSGLIGAAWHKSTNKWQSSIRINGKCVHIGYFDNPIDASNAYLAKRKEIGI